MSNFITHVPKTLLLWKRTAKTQNVKIGLAPELLHDELSVKFHQLLAENKALQLRLKNQQQRIEAVEEVELKLKEAVNDLVAAKEGMRATASKLREVTQEFKEFRKDCLDHYLEREKAFKKDMVTLKRNILAVRVPELYLHGVIPYHHTVHNKKSAFKTTDFVTKKHNVSFEQLVHVGSTYTSEKYNDRVVRMGSRSQSRIGQYINSFHRRQYGLINICSESGVEEFNSLEGFEAEMFGNCPMSKKQKMEMMKSWHQMGMLTDELLEEELEHLESLEEDEDFDYLSYEVENENSLEFLAAATEADRIVQLAAEPTIDDLPENAAELVHGNSDMTLKEEDISAQSDTVTDEIEKETETSVFDNTSADLGPRRRRC
ncbi:hypothetical protein BCR33DRAFT_780861 [Rhizoclosmatium globosum]|uniref:Uncharacterized protein n=1 Tax=Rhizoclosmatium globosum TaxID=329046 RepID=A0A1Y2CW09_9FUNG|nr:hypothetical protein BCR33DRAFT_780861 [Rhizoclosmatium globosum]|eukprot:ORY50984.1 hypothetical protein BCR33DRAFT_780861 [Rhizoclosmatium globosum]